MIRYTDCHMSDVGCSDCAQCTLSSSGRDCHGNPVNQVAYIRTLAGMTQTQLATAANVSMGQVRKWEYNQQPIGGTSLRIAVRVADALGVDVKKLL